MFDLEAEAGKLTNEMVAAGIELELGFFDNVIEVIAGFLGFFCKRVELVHGSTDFDCTERDDDVEFFFKDFVVFD